MGIGVRKGELLYSKNLNFSMYISVVLIPMSEFYRPDTDSLVGGEIRIDLLGPSGQTSSYIVHTELG